MLQVLSNGQMRQTMLQQRDGHTHLFSGYSRHESAWDELFAAAGQPHPYCSALVERLGLLRVDEFQQRRAART